MNKTSYMVYWTLIEAYGEEFDDMNKALIFMQELRRTGRRHVTMSAENANQIGSMGVDAVKDGILPDGQEYVYKTGRDQGR